MFDIRLLRNEPDRVREGMRKRRAKVDLEAVFAVDTERRAKIYEMEQLRAGQNKVTAEVAAKKRAGEDASEAIAAMKDIKDRIAVLEEEVRGADARLDEFLLTIPNLPDDSVPEGNDEADNPVVRTWGAPPVFDFAPKDHVELGEALGLFDFGCGAKLAGARFGLSRGAGALLERALAALMLDMHTREHGYTEVLPPFMVNSDSMRGTGQLPKFAADLFKVENTDYWMIPTAEVPVTNIHRDEILDAAALPLCYTAHTPCFRSEAGS